MNTAAVNNPVTRRKAEVNTGDFAVGQKDPIILGDHLPDREAIAVSPPVDSPKQLSKYLQDLTFFEDPVTIRIEQVNMGLTKFAPKVQDCWCNGKGAEQLIDGKWVTFGWLPVGVPVTTKRKYVEVLLRAKLDNVTTEVRKHDTHEENIINRNTASSCPISILSDASPAGRDWVEKILREG